MKHAGILCLLLAACSSLLWAQAGTEPWSAPLVWNETAAATTTLETEIAAVSAQIEALQLVGETPSAELQSRLIELERADFARRHDVSSLDQGAETCSGATVIPASDNVAFCEVGLMGSTTDCALVGSPTAFYTYKDVFYSFTPTVTGNYLLSCCGSIGDLQILVWTGTCCAGTFPAATYRDDATCAGGDPRKQMALTAGTTYYIELGYKTDATPDAYQFHLSGPIPATPAVPANDVCTGAIPVAIGASIDGSSLGATDDTGLPTCVAAGLFNGVWYSIVGDGRTLTASTAGTCTNFNTYLKVYRGTCAALACAGALDNISPDISASAVSWCADPGMTYYIGIGSTATGVINQGNFALSIAAGDICSCDAFPLCGTPTETEPNHASPINCTTFDAIELTCGAAIYARHCPEPDSDYYKITVPAGQSMTIALYDGAACATNPPTKVFSRLYTSACATSGAATAANKVINNIAGSTDVTQYILVLDAVPASPINRSTYKLVATCVGVPTNDLCANAQAVAIPSSTNGTTVYGTTDVVPSCFSTPAQPGVWYKLTGNGHTLVADACVTSFDNRIIVFSGPDCDNLTCHGGDDASCGGNGAKYTFCTVPGETYWILVYGSTFTTGTFTLGITDLGVCAQNDKCSGAVAVAIPSATPGTTVGYSRDNAPTCFMTPSTEGVWYTVVGNGGMLTADLCADWANFDSRMAVYSGACDNLICVGGNDNGGCSELSAASVTWCSEAGVNYWILVYGYAGFTGAFTLTVAPSTTPDCPNVALPGQYAIGPCLGSVADNGTVVKTIHVPLRYHITDLDARINLTHSNVSDLSLLLVTPWLDTLELTSNNGDGGDNYVNTVFDDEAPGLITAGAAPFTGRFVPEALLSAADGYDARGDWQFVISDGLATNGGNIYCLSLEFSHDYILAVQLAAGFVATPGDGSVSLTWATASESENARFEIVRDGAVVATRNGQGTSSARTDYSWTDEGLSNGRTYSYSLVSLDLQGQRSTIATANATPLADAGTVTAYALRQNYPNPFNPTTTIGFDLLESGFVSLKVYNLMGQNVMTLVNGTMTTGRHSVALDAASLSSGIYLYRIEANGFSAEKKMLLMK